MGWSEPTTVLYIALLDLRNALCRLSSCFSRYVVYWFFSTLSHISLIYHHLLDYTQQLTHAVQVPARLRMYGDDVTPQSGFCDFHSKVVSRYRPMHVAYGLWRSLTPRNGVMVECVFKMEGSSSAPTDECVNKHEHRDSWANSRRGMAMAVLVWDGERRTIEL